MEVSDVPLALRERLAAVVTSAAVERFERRLRVEIAQLWLGRETLTPRCGSKTRELGVRLGGEIASLRQETVGAVAALRQDNLSGLAALRQENLDGRFELFKWCFMFWVGQVFAVPASSPWCCG